MSSVLVRWGYRPPLAMYAAPARRFIDDHLAGALVFEFSVGMLTLWYLAHGARVFAVEHDPRWFELVESRVPSGSNVTLVLAEEKEYVSAIDRTGIAAFDVISIDGMWRYACFRSALGFMKPGGLLVIDDTDKDRARPAADLHRIDTEPGGHFSETQIHRFPGYAHGCFVPHATTVAVRGWS